MARVARRVHDKQVLRLIRRYLEAGVMADGVKQRSEEGTPQGSPLSPLLANVLLDDLDQELGRRGHRFVRYADDLIVYVASERAGQRVMQSITQFVEQRLKLRVNRDKSAVDRATKRPFLGFAFFRPRRSGESAARSRRPASGPRTRVRELTARNWGISMERRIRELNRFTVGWTTYFALADTPSAFEELDEWLRRRLTAGALEGVEAPPDTAAQPARARHPRASSPRMGRLRQRATGASLAPAPSQRALPNAYWADLGLRGFSDPYRRLRDATRTAGCGPACPVVWEGPG